MGILLTVEVQMAATLNEEKNRYQQDDAMDGKPTFDPGLADNSRVT